MSSLGWLWSMQIYTNIAVCHTNCYNYNGVVGTSQEAEGALACAILGAAEITPAACQRLAWPTTGSLPSRGQNKQTHKGPLDFNMMPHNQKYRIMI